MGLDVAACDPHEPPVRDPRPGQAFQPAQGRASSPGRARATVARQPRPGPRPKAPVAETAPIPFASGPSATLQASGFGGRLRPDSALTRPRAADQVRPHAHTLAPASPVLARALVRWQHAAGPFWPYVCAAPFLAERVPPPRTRQSRADGSLLTLLMEHTEGRACAFVDLPPTAALGAAPELNQRGRLVVPVVQRWSAAATVLPCEPVIRLLLAVSRRLNRPADPVGAVFYLDGDRSGHDAHVPARLNRGRAFDNRYLQSSNLLPPASLLLAFATPHVAWVSPGPIAPDVHAYLQALRAAGIASVHVPFTRLCTPPHTASAPP